MRSREGLELVPFSSPQKVAKSREKVAKKCLKTPP